MFLFYHAYLYLQVTLFRSLHTEAVSHTSPRNDLLHQNITAMPKIIKMDFLDSRSRLYSRFPESPPNVTLIYYLFEQGLAETYVLLLVCVGFFPSRRAPLAFLIISLLLFTCFETVSLCSPCLPGTCYTDQAGFKLQGPTNSSIISMCHSAQPPLFCAPWH